MSRAIKRNKSTADVTTIITYYRGNAHEYTHVYIYIYTKYVRCGRLDDDDVVGPMDGPERKREKKYG